MALSGAMHNLGFGLSPAVSQSEWQDFVFCHRLELLLPPFWRHEVYLHAPLILQIPLVLMQLLQNILGVQPAPKSFFGTQ